MTRDRSGRGPGATRRTNPQSKKHSGDPRSAPGRGSRVTPPADESDGTRARRRSVWVRIGVFVFVAFILFAMILGCAPYDGDEAAFCDGLRRAPSFAELSAQVQDGTEAQAAATMSDAAERFRVLEREAPRSIRHTVASLGDSAERIAADLAPGSADMQTVTVSNADGTVTEVQVAGRPNRISAFYNELQQHRGTIGALDELMRYARDDCGITDRDVDLGMPGFGLYQSPVGSPFPDDPTDRPGPSDGPANGPFDGPSERPTDDDVIIAPSTSTVP